MIQNILILQPIFAPDEKQTQRNVNSITALGEYLKQHGTDGLNVSISMGGWAKTDELWHKVIMAGKQQFGEKFNPTRFDKNYGKAYVINNLYRSVIGQKLPIDAIISMDSDIIFSKDVNHIFTRLVVAAEKMEEVKKIKWGLIGLNQLEAGCHLSSCYQNQAEYNISIRGKTYNEKIIWPTISSGIAGGCLFLNRELFDQAGGYRQFGVYAGDDAFILYDCGRLGYSYQVSESIGIIHPHDSDPEYAKWKVSVCQRDTSTGEKTDITSQINEANEFWNNKPI